MVLPAYQRRGIGRAIINFAVANIDHQSLPIYLNSSMSGAPLYEKMGWKVVDVVTVGDATPQDPGTEGYISRSMIASFPVHAKV
jgi:GNAT superfamily N-acetyltransferase